MVERQLMASNPASIYVEYRGNEGVLRSYVDLERLFETNLAGTEVFGGISTPVQGSEDLNPHLNRDTLLSTINGGEGLSRNAAISVSVNTGITTETSVVDLAGAVTIGDVARLIELGAPAGTTHHRRGHRNRARAANHERDNCRRRGCAGPGRARTGNLYRAPVRQPARR